jgi:hypothetical protein
MARTAFNVKGIVERARSRSAIQGSSRETGGPPELNVVAGLARSFAGDAGEGRALLLHALEAYGGTALVVRDPRRTAQVRALPSRRGSNFWGGPQAGTDLAPLVALSRAADPCRIGLAPSPYAP